MPDRRLRHTVRSVTTLQRAHHAAPTPRCRSRDNRPGELVEIVKLEGEAAKRVPGERDETRRNEDDVRHEVRGRRVDRLLQRSHVLSRRQATAQRYVPDG